MADIRTLDLNLLRALDALLDERSVTRAAARLGLTQPAVSGALARLREAFGDPLFVRTQRGVLPTPRAQALAGPLRRLLADAEALVRPAEFDPATAEMLLRLAATDYAERTLVAPFLAALRAEAPRARLAVRPLEEAHVLAQMERGDFDLALMRLEAAPPALYALRLLDERYVCALRADHPDAAGPLSLDRFCALDHALVSLAGGGFRGPTDTALAALGRRRRVAVSVPSFLALPALLRASDLVAAVPERLLRGVSGVALLPLPLDVPGFTMIAAWHERTHHDPAHRWARTLLAAVAARSAAQAEPRMSRPAWRSGRPRP